jgi:hypothetical protein
MVGVIAGVFTQLQSTRFTNFWTAPTTCLFEWFRCRAHHSIVIAALARSTAELAFGAFLAHIIIFCLALRAALYIQRII